MLGAEDRICSVCAVMSDALRRPVCAKPVQLVGFYESVASGKPIGNFTPFKPTSNMGDNNKKNSSEHKEHFNRH
ncbi:MAG: hypothetical protein HRT36_08570 [Alphaproteobacteria bacterium]|nr:hypothetical protein [Alphaproteobacteria bacterium]